MTFRLLAAVLLPAVVLSFSPVRAELSPELRQVLATDAPDSADSKLTGRYEGSVIIGQTVKAFDELTLPNGPAEGEEYDNEKKFTSTVTLQGKVTRTMYLSPEGRSSLEVFANFKDALTEKGFAPAFECAKEACGPSFKVLKYAWDKPETKVISEKAEQLRNLVGDAMLDKIIDPRYVLMTMGEGDEVTTVAVFAGQNQGGTFGTYSEAIQNRVGVLVEIVEPKGREKKMVTISAEEIDSTITADGKIILYGILFDFDKATIKPESQPQLDEMAHYLESNADEKVFVVGHTDNQGEIDYNMKLSAARADAVVKALAKAGISSKRLVAKGVGPLVPVASNRSEEGQALNRRVELVEQ